MSKITFITKENKLNFQKGKLYITKNKSKIFYCTNYIAGCAGACCMWASDPNYIGQHTTDLGSSYKTFGITYKDLEEFKGNIVITEE